jgi:4-amino-4-deoxy-L-arabinose transferase-like glycosyltransferase
VLRRPWLAAGVAIVAGYLLSRALFVTRFPYFLDEGTYAVFTYKAAHSLHDLFISYTIAREPLMFWLGIPWVKLGFNPLHAVRIVSVIAGLLTVGVIGLLGRRYGGSLVGVIAAALCVVLPFFLVHDGIGIIEPLVTLVMAAALYLQIEFARRPDLRVALLLGLVLAAGVLTKENTKPSLVLVPLSLLCLDWSPEGRRGRLIAWLRGIGLAAVMVVGAYLLLHASSRYPEFEKARHNGLLYTVRPLSDVLSDPFATIGHTWSAYHPAFSGYVTLPLLAVALAGTVLGLRTRWRMTVVLLGWILVPLTVSLLFSTAPFPRHVMYLIPPGIVLAAYGFAEGWRCAQRSLPARWALPATAAAAFVLLIPAVHLDARVLAHPASTRYPGLDDLQYVTGTGGGTPWPSMADEIRKRARGKTVYMLAPTAYTQVLEMLLGPSARYQTVVGTDPRARRAQFVVADEIPFLDATSSKLTRELGFTPILRYQRPRGGAVATLLARPR